MFAPHPSKQVINHRSRTKSPASSISAIRGILLEIHSWLMVISSNSGNLRNSVKICVADIDFTGIQIEVAHREVVQLGGAESVVPVEPVYETVVRTAKVVGTNLRRQLRLAERVCAAVSHHYTHIVIVPEVLVHPNVPGIGIGKGNVRDRDWNLVVVEQPGTIRLRNILDQFL